MRMVIDTVNNVRHLRRPSTAKGQRLRANLPARVKAGPARTSCMVTDMSSGGACLSFEGPLDQEAELWLIIDSLPPISAKAVWRKSNRIGVTFEREQDWVHQVHKDRFDPAAWIKTTTR
jgi:hypothetical protein